MMIKGNNKQRCNGVFVAYFRHIQSKPSIEHAYLVLLSLKSLGAAGGSNEFSSVHPSVCLSVCNSFSLRVAHFFLPQRRPVHLWFPV